MKKSIQKSVIVLSSDNIYTVVLKRWWRKVNSTNLHSVNRDELDGAVGPRNKIQVDPVGTSPAHVAREDTVAYAVPVNIREQKKVDTFYIQASIHHAYIHTCKQQ